MSTREDDRDILILNASPTFEPADTGSMMASGRAPIAAIKANMNVLLADCRAMFEEASKSLEGGRLSHVDLSLAIALDGSVGLFGTRAGAEARGGMTVRIEFGEKPS